MVATGGGASARSKVFTSMSPCAFSKCMAPAHQAPRSVENGKPQLRKVLSMLTQQRPENGGDISQPPRNCLLSSQNKLEKMMLNLYAGKENACLSSL